MNRNQFATWGLVVSAMLLAALLLVNLPRQMAAPAHAELLLNKDTFTLMTATSRPGEEALFLLDSVNERLLIYNVNLARKRIEKAGALDMGQIFGGPGAPVGGVKPGERIQR